MAATPEEVESLIDTAAAGPKQVTTDGMSVVGQSIPDMIALQRLKQEQASARKGSVGFGRFRTRSQGAT